MGISYSIQMILDAKLNIENIKIILERSQQRGCLFYESGKYEYFNAAKNITLNVKDAIKKIFETYQDAEHSGLIIAVKENTIFLLSFNQENHDLVFSLTLMAYDWEKEFPNDEIHKDFARYISLLLYITQDFPILNLCIKYL